MAVTAYASLDEFLAQPEITSDDPRDDEYIADLLERASRELDGDTGYWFYADTQTRYYDLPKTRRLKLDGPLLSLTSLTNGDGTVIPATEFFTWPYNDPHVTAIELNEISAYYWLPSLTAGTKRVVAVTGQWGYVNRAATDPESAIVISNSKAAVLALALTVYKKRYGQGAEGIAQVTSAGVVITPRDKSKDYWQTAIRLRNIL